MKARNQLREWIARILIGLVLGMNLACAIEFMSRPKLYLSAYELSGEVGRAVIIGYGILFLMWQVPYFFAFYSPKLHKVSLIQAILMQGIGLIGESLLFRTIPMENPVLRGSILRFIWFDGGGLVFLILALMIGSRNHATKTELNF
ncbi:MAG: hypothetical protein AAGU03_07035 [Anaerolineaceae bacterium]